MIPNLYNLCQFSPNLSVCANLVPTVKCWTEIVDLTNGPNKKLFLSRQPTHVQPRHITFKKTTQSHLFLTCVLGLQITTQHSKPQPIASSLIREPNMWYIQSTSVHTVHFGPIGLIQSIVVYFSSLWSIPSTLVML